MITRASFWLLPAAAEQAVFQELIHDLALRYDGPVFEPHVTLYSGTYAPDERLDAILAQAGREAEPLRLHVDTVAYTAQFTKTLFVQFQPSLRLSRLSERLRAHASQPSDYVLDPHLSLMYKHMSEAEQRRLAASIRVPLDTVTFDAVCVTVAPTPTRSPQDVARWEIRWRQKWG
jgi:hypothetical protein